MRSSVRSTGASVSRPSRPLRSLQVVNSVPLQHESGVLDTSVLERHRGLILDGAFRPLAIVNWHHALTLDLFRSVEVLEYYDCFVQTVREAYPIPAVLRSSFIRKGIATFKLPPSKRNVLRRDNFACVYCGSTSNLTLDHVVPISKGGSNGWDNVVTACRPCNELKGNRSLEQMGWRLRRKPTRPRSLDLHMAIDWPKSHPEEWSDYIAHLKK